MILVTGGAGYIGSVTTNLLIAHGENVVILDNLSRGHRLALPASAPFYEGDIGDRQLLRRITSEHQVDACIHFAALAYVGESVVDPARYFHNNVEQGIRLLDGLIEGNVKQLVFSSTCATYGEPQTIPISENHPQKPTNPYGWSKLFMERIMESYDQAYGLKFVALRYFNACGAAGEVGEDHDPETHLIPNVLRAALGKTSVVSVFGDNYPTPDGTPIRDYIHVSDLADAHVRALEHLRGGGKSERINLGNGHGYSVLEVIEAARQVTGKPIAIRIEPPRPGDPSRLVADARYARTVLGWNPQYTELASILWSDWDWRLNHPDGYS
ncbi:MAG TPA: UDP-glucose 4-epimerase GalE [Pyrinomonadaceae bacterium]|jgi:UDP-glucose 4-epimerase|nr:UDP-glucose 4-epimerase GalE [Pyrinomonadaceae bacterium]